jgi:hypothetical protein
MRSSPIILMLLLSSSGLAAQTNSATTPAIFLSPPASESCPVNFSAERRPNGALVQVDHGVTFRGQGVEINLSGSSSAPILKVDLKLHGMTPGVHIAPASVGGPTAKYSTEIFQLASNDGSPLQHSSVSSARLGTVDWLELTRIEFANGTTWQSSAESRCVVAPSLLVLVDSSAQHSAK